MNWMYVTVLPSKVVSRLKIKAVVALTEIRTMDLLRRGHQFRICSREWKVEKTGGYRALRAVR